MYSNVRDEMRKIADPEKVFLTFILNLICFLFKKLLIFPPTGRQNMMQVGKADTFDHKNWFIHVHTHIPPYMNMHTCAHTPYMHAHTHTEIHAHTCTTHINTCEYTRTHISVYMV